MTKPDLSDAARDASRAIEAKLRWMVRTMTIRFAIMWGTACFIIWLFGFY